MPIAPANAEELRFRLQPVLQVQTGLMAGPFPQFISPALNLFMRRDDDIFQFVSHNILSEGVRFTLCRTGLSTA